MRKSSQGNIKVQRDKKTEADQSRNDVKPSVAEYYKNYEEDFSAASLAPQPDDFEIGEAPKKHGAGQKIWLIITDIFLALCILVFAGAIYMTTQAKKSGEAVEILGYRPFLIATGSMEPTFAINGFVVTRSDDFASVKIGDVVAFRAAGLNGKPALHRVIATGGDAGDP